MPALAPRTWPYLFLFARGGARFFLDPTYPPLPRVIPPRSYRVRDIHRDVPSIAGAITSGDRRRKRSTYATRDSDGPTNRGIALGVVNSKAINVVALVLKVTIVFASIRLLIKFVLLLRTSWIIIISVKLSRQENARIRENPFFFKKKNSARRETYLHFAKT